MYNNTITSKAYNWVVKTEKDDSQFVIMDRKANLYKVNTCNNLWLDLPLND